MCYSTHAYIHKYCTYLSHAVFKDRGGRTRRKEFHTKQDVEKHLTELGEGVGVFICYAPDPDSPYFDPELRRGVINQAERHVFQLVNDLERHGFSVMTDLHVRSQDHPSNWLKWYSNRIADSDHVILVCSPAFNELFSREKLEGSLKDERAKLLFHYSRSIYGELLRETGNRSKFIPVILNPVYNSESCIPSLFDPTSVCHLYEDKPPRQFDYDRRTGTFERLVCRMAGINRELIDRDEPVGVQQVSGVTGKQLVSYPAYM